MNIVSIGGGPAGLYFGILMKAAQPSATVSVYERNRPDDTFGFGVVFSDATLQNLEDADPRTYAAITEKFAHWDDIDTFVAGRKLTSTGHGFCGLERKELLLILQRRARELGVELHFESNVEDFEAVRKSADLVLAADGVGSQVRNRYADSFGPTVDERPNRFVWLGTDYPFDAFTFYFTENEAGLWRVHAYRYSETGSTFIVECTDETFQRAGLDVDDEDKSIAYLEQVFAAELKGHRLTKNRSIWRRFPTVSNRSWSHKNVVLVGDAAHTAHFSIGSGTKLAMEDVIDLRRALSNESDIPSALKRYESERRPVVEKIQRAAQVSLEWFENTERYKSFSPEQFTFSLMTRSLRVTHGSLSRGDPELVAAVDGEFAEEHGAPKGTPPMFVPLALGDVQLENRVVAASLPIAAGSDGLPSDVHLAHVVSRALGGAGLVMAGMAGVSAKASSPGGNGLWSDQQATAWQRIIDCVHAESSARIGICLGHAGPTSQTPLLPAEAMTRIESLAEDFSTSARQAAAAGFDLVSVDAADGHLLSRVLSPLTNPGLELVARIDAVTRIVGRARDAFSGILAVRLCACDWVSGGLTGSDAVIIARALKTVGVDLIDVTSGGNRPEVPVPRTRLYQAQLSDQVRCEAEIPTIASGGIASYDDVNSLVLAGRADLCSLGRAFAVDPGFVGRAARAQKFDLRLPPLYRAADGFSLRE